MRNAEELFHSQLSQIENALCPWVIDTDAGQFIDPTHAPEELVEMHRGMVRIGYAKGWL